LSDGSWRSSFSILALPDLPGWFLAIGLLGAIPAFVCSWVVLTTDKTQGVKA
jgi:hypothetical protein